MTIARKINLPLYIYYYFHLLFKSQNLSICCSCNSHDDFLLCKTSLKVSLISKTSDKRITRVLTSHQLCMLWSVFFWLYELNTLYAATILDIMTISLLLYSLTKTFSFIFGRGWSKFWEVLIWEVKLSLPNLSKLSTRSFNFYRARGVGKLFLQNPSQVVPEKFSFLRMG